MVACSVCLYIFSLTSALAAKSLFTAIRVYRVTFSSDYLSEPLIQSIKSKSKPASGFQERSKLRGVNVLLELPARERMDEIIS